MVCLCSQIVWLNDGMVGGMPSARAPLPLPRAAAKGRRTSDVSMILVPLPQPRG